MKNKIYIKLFEFCDQKSWTLRGSNIYESTFYEEYKLEFRCEDICWYYTVYPRKYSKYSDSYDEEPEYIGAITLNNLGKFFYSLIMFGILFGIKLWIGIDGYIWLLPIISIFLSYFQISIFNWKFYKSLKLVKYTIDNIQTIREKESEEELNNQIVEIVNKKMGENPRLTRKEKLKQIKKSE